MALAVLNGERVLGYAEQWRSLARDWARLAGKEHNAQAASLRHAAQMALYAAYEAEQLLRARDRWRPRPAAAAVPRRPGPVVMGPVSLAGQRPRLGWAYSTRIAGRRG